MLCLVDLAVNRPEWLTTEVRSFRLRETWTHVALALSSQEALLFEGAH